jgi:hypothetical protein
MKDHKLRDFLGIDDEKIEGYARLPIFELDTAVARLSSRVDELEDSIPYKIESWEKEFDDLFVGKVTPAGYMSMIGDTLQEKAKHADWLFKRDKRIKKFIKELLKSNPKD